jgi:hypothetical protein
MQGLVVRSATTIGVAVADRLFEKDRVPEESVVGTRPVAGRLWGRGFSARSDRVSVKGHTLRQARSRAQPSS